MSEPKRVEVEEAVAMLRAMEWCGMTWWKGRRDCCGWCGAKQSGGAHAEGCKLAELLARYDALDGKFTREELDEMYEKQNRADERELSFDRLLDENEALRAQLAELTNARAMD